MIELGKGSSIEQRPISYLQMYSWLAFFRNQPNLYRLDYDFWICHSNCCHYPDFISNMLENFRGKVIVDNSNYLMLQNNLTRIYYVYFGTYTIFQLRQSITSDKVRRMASERDRKAFQMILSMSIAYLLCWSPYAGLSFIHIFISRK